MTVHVGLDLDGVFADFQTRYEDLYWPFAEPCWDVYDGYAKRYSSEEFKRQIKSMARQGHYGSLDLYPGAKACWDRLRALPNVKLHVITYRPKEAWEDTVYWLKFHSLDCDTLSFSADKTILRALAGKPAAFDCRGLLIAIDDWDKHWQANADVGVRSYLCDRPWNRGNPTVTLDGFADRVEKLHARYG